MKNHLDLNIKTPCAEDFNTFSTTKNGGFCGACKCEVVDFTKMTSDEMISYFKHKSSKTTCGRFTSSQLSSYKSVNNRRSFISFFSGIGLACIALFSFGSIKAQNAKKQIQPLDTDRTKKQDTAYQNTITVKGKIITSDDGLPLPGASIIVEGTSIGVQSDFDGNFKFSQKLKKGDVLVISYVGLKSQKIVLQDEKSASNVELKIDMSCGFDDVILMGKVAVKKVYKSKRN